MKMKIVGGEAWPVVESMAEWLCQYRTNVTAQSEKWCVPGCMAILSSLGLLPVKGDAAWFASQWGQKPGEEVDAYFAAFSDFCTKKAAMEVLVDYSDPAVHKPWDWMVDLRRPTLIAFDSHAIVCIGVCSNLYCASGPCKGFRVLNPADPTRPDDWMSFPPAGLDVRFAFRVETDCPVNVPVRRESPLTR